MKKVLNILNGKTWEMSSNFELLTQINFVHENFPSPSWPALDQVIRQAKSPCLMPRGGLIKPQMVETRLALAHTNALTYCPSTETQLMTTN